MIPVLGVPTLTGRRLGAMLASIDVPVGRLVIVDNGKGAADGLAPDAWHIRLPANLGVAASWNLIIKTHIDAPWWCLVNDDIEFAPGDLARLAEAMETADLATLDGFAAFGLSSRCLDRVGFFDENFHPAYCEDCDYERRCQLAGIDIVSVPSGLRHERSSTLADGYATANARTYPLNRAYHLEKWGVGVRAEGGYDTPFDFGGDVGEWTLDPTRLRSLSWA